jgi:hypothetical protein
LPTWMSPLPGWTLLTPGGLLPVPPPTGPVAAVAAGAIAPPAITTVETARPIPNFQEWLRMGFPFL